MKVEQEYKNNPLAKQIYNCARSSFERLNVTVIPVTSIDTFSVTARKLGMDVRVLLESQPGTASVFEGVDFDKNNTRTQAIAVMENDTPVALLTFVVIPVVEQEKQRYLTMTDGKIQIADFKSIWSVNPDYLVVPGYAKVDDAHLLRFSIPGVRTFMNTLSVLKDSSPRGTWVELVTQGQATNDQCTFIDKIVKMGAIGDDIKESLGFVPLSIFGKSQSESKATTKFARLLGLKMVNNTASVPTLGPVYGKEIKHISLLNL